MTIIVFGGGAIGSLYAAKLAPLNDVTLIARPAHVEAINRDGLRLIGVEERTCRLRAAADLDAIPPASLVLLTTKVNDNATAGRAIAERAPAGTIVLCLQNGLGGEEIVRQAFERAGRHGVVLRGITQFGAIFREPGVVDYKVAGVTIIQSGPDSQALADLFTGSGLDGRVSERIEIDVWRKLIFNCVINPITSITGTDVGSIADPRLDPLKQLVIDECLAVARSQGVRFDIDFLAALSEVFGSSRNIASMRQDLARGRPTEIDWMNGAVVDAGRRAGIACPVNAALVAIVKALEKGKA